VRGRAQMPVGQRRGVGLRNRMRHRDTQYHVPYSIRNGVYGWWLVAGSRRTSRVCAFLISLSLSSFFQTRPECNSANSAIVGSWPEQTALGYLSWSPASLSCLWWTSLARLRQTGDSQVSAPKGSDRLVSGTDRDRDKREAVHPSQRSRLACHPEHGRHPPCSPPPSRARREVNWIKIPQADSWMSTA
jgi:hypothetical protein